LNLVLVRHGVTDWNEAGRLLGRMPVPINERGRRQAAAAAAALSGLSPAAILASPQRRAQQTAAIIAERHGAAVRTEAALAEVRADKWQGRRFEELAGEPDVRRYLEDPTYAGGTFEPAASVHLRVMDLVARLRDQGGDKPTILVSHGDPLRLLVTGILSLELRFYRRLAVGPGSISVLRVGPGGGRLLLLNWTPSGPQGLSPLSDG